MEQPTGKDYRNFVKDKCLIFLSFIKEKSGDSADFPAGEIANRTGTKYNSIRTLLHRWSQKPFLYTTPGGKVIKRKGFGLVKEVDESRWHLAYDFGYRITQKGLNYLEYAKIHHKFYGLAEDIVVRRSSNRAYWFDIECHGMFVIRPPFADGQDFGQIKLEELPENQDHPLDGNQWIFARGGLSEAFEMCEPLSRPPSQEFRQYVWEKTEKVKREWLATHPPTKATSLSPIVKPNDVNSVGIPRLHINPQNLEALERELKDHHDNQEP